MDGSRRVLVDMAKKIKGEVGLKPVGKIPHA